MRPIFPRPSSRIVVKITPMSHDPSNSPPQESQPGDHSQSDLHWRTRLIHTPPPPEGARPAPRPPPPPPWPARLIHSAAQPPAGFRSLTTPTYRASTAVFDTLADAYQSWRPGGPYTYVIYGAPTTLKLAARIA